MPTFAVANDSSDHVVLGLLLLRIVQVSQIEVLWYCDEGFKGAYPGRLQAPTHIHIKDFRVGELE